MSYGELRCFILIYTWYFKEGYCLMQAIVLNSVPTPVSHLVLTLLMTLGQWRLLLDVMHLMTDPLSPDYCDDLSALFSYYWLIKLTALFTFLAVSTTLIFFLQEDYQGLFSTDYRSVLHSNFSYCLFSCIIPLKMGKKEKGTTDISP